MALIRASDVQIGMELATDVLDDNGRLMLRGGITVSERELRLFKMWGISEIEVVTDDNEPDVPDSLSLDPELAAEYEPATRELFRHADLTHPVMSQLFRECLSRLAKGKISGGRHAAS